MKNKLIVVTVLLTIVLLTGLAIDTYLLNSKLLTTVTGSVMKIESDVYTSSNSSEFKSKSIDTIVRRTNDVYADADIVSSIPLLGSDCVIRINVPKNIVYFYNYNNAVFSRSGDYYISVGTTKEDIDYTKTTLKEKFLGFNKPIVLEFKFATSSNILYIQCYTTESYNFFVDKDNWATVDTSHTKRVPSEEEIKHKDYYNGRPPIELYSNTPLNKPLVDLTNTEAIEGFLNFNEYKSMEFNYSKFIGKPKEIFSTYYDRIDSLGFELEYFNDNGEYYYLVYDTFVVIFKNLTLNSSYVYSVNMRVE